MMSLHEPSQSANIIHLLRFKLQSYASYFTTLVFIQLAVLLLSLQSVSSSYEYESYSMEFIGVQSGIHIGAIMFWALIAGSLLASKLKREEAFTFVATNKTHHFSNIIFMLVASFITSLIAILVSPAFKMIAILRYGEIYIATNEISLAIVLNDTVLLFITAFCYISLFFAIGYTVTSLAQINQGLTWIIIFIVLLLMFVFGFGFDILGIVIEFFTAEESLALFVGKIVVTVTVLYTIVMMFTSRNEVRN